MKPKFGTIQIPVYYDEEGKRVCMDENGYCCNYYFDGECEFLNIEIYDDYPHSDCPIKVEEND